MGMYIAGSINAAALSQGAPGFLKLLRFISGSCALLTLSEYTRLNSCDVGIRSAARRAARIRAFAAKIGRLCGGQLQSERKIRFAQLLIKPRGDPGVKGALTSPQARLWLYECVSWRMCR